MKITMDRKALEAAAVAAAKVAEKKSVKPILECVLIEATEGGLVRLTSTDLEVAMRYLFIGGTELAGDVVVDDPGAVVIDAGVLAQIVRAGEADLISISRIDGEPAHIVCGADTYDLPVAEADEFPVFPEPPEKGRLALELDAATLSCALLQVTHAAASVPSSYALNGVLLASEERGERVGLRLVAANGHCLCTRRIETEAVAGKAQSTIAPVPGLARLHNLLPSEGNVTLTLSPNQVRAEADGWELAMIPISGQYPDWNDIVPEPEDVSLAVPADALAATVARAAIVTDPESVGVQVKIAGGEVLITAQAPNRGRAEARLPVLYTGEAMEAVLNAKYLIATLKPLDGTEVRIEIRGNNKPTTIRTDDFIGLIMPITREDA